MVSRGKVEKGMDIDAAMSGAAYSAAQRVSPIRKLWGIFVPSRSNAGGDLAARGPYQERKSPNRENFLENALTEAFPTVIFEIWDFSRCLCFNRLSCHRQIRLHGSSGR